MARAFEREKWGSGGALSKSPRLNAIQLTLLAGALVLALALLARILSFPLRHDEEMYLPAGVLFTMDGLYRDLGYNHLPNLPILLKSVLSVTGMEHVVLVGRLLVFAAWIAAAGALAAIAQRATGRLEVTALLVLLLAVNPLLLGPAGMIFSNNFLPVPIALLGLHLFVSGIDGAQVRPPMVFAAGLLIAVAAGFKANYVALILPFAIAALFVPRHLPVAARLRTVALPLLAGGILGAVPTLAYLVSGPSAFLSHVIGYHRGPHVQYWSAHAMLDGAKVMSLPGKAALAYDVWFSGAAMLIPFGIVFLFCAGFAKTRRLAELIDWRVVLAASLTAVAALISFVPTPAFPQYFVPPLPFALVLIAFLYARLPEEGRRVAEPFVAASGAMALILGVPMIAPSLFDLLRPEAWTSSKVDAVAGQISSEVKLAGGAGRVATLAPVYVLEAGLPVEPTLAAGPFVYRVADLIPPRDRRHYSSLASPRTIGAVLSNAPPSGVLVGLEGQLDQPLEQFARSRGYERRLSIPVERGERLTLYVAPGGRGAPPAAASRHPSPAGSGRD